MPSFRDYSVNLSSEASTSSKSSGVVDPPGYRQADPSKDVDAGRTQRTPQQKEELIVKGKQRAAWDYATGQVKALLPLGFMAFMSGNAITMWTIMITYNTVATPIRNLLGATKEFERFKDSKGRVDVLFPLVIFCSIWLGALALALVKLDYIGILPKTLLDWVSAMPPAHYREISVPAVALAAP